MIALMGEEDDLKRRHHIPEQIIRKLREAGRLLGEVTKPGGRSFIIWTEFPGKDQLSRQKRSELSYTKLEGSSSNITLMKTFILIL